MKKRLFLLSMTLLCVIGLAKAENILTAENTSGSAGSTAVLAISITNDEIIGGYQFDLQLPDGVTISENDIAITDRANDIKPSFKYDETNDVYKFAGSTGGSNRIDIGSGVVLNITLHIDSDADLGDKTINIKTIKFASDDGQRDIVVTDTSATLTVEEAEEPVVIEDFQFYAKKITIDEKTKTATLDICLNNSDVVRNFSFGLILPKGVSVKQEYDSDWNEYYDDIQKGTRLTGDYSKKTEENKIIFSYTAKRETTIPIGDDVLLSINLDINITPSMCDIQLSNQSITKMSNSAVSPSDFTSILKVNGEETVEVNVSDKNWATLCLPFKYDLSENQNAKGLKVYEATGIEDGHVVLNEIESKVIPAVTPVLINGESVTFSIAEDNSAAKKLQYTNGVLTGYLAAGVAKAGFVLQNQENNGFGFYKINSEVPINIPAYRCVLNIPDNTNPAEAPRYINLNNAATSIESIENEGIHDNAIYTLDGRRVETMTKGNTYIINGTKVIIK